MQQQEDAPQPEETSPAMAPVDDSVAAPAVETETTTTTTPSTTDNRRQRPGQEAETYDEQSPKFARKAWSMMKTSVHL